jgi:hypothetical protein
MRRDYEKYLSLIATITLLHQYQREERDGYLIATLDDVALANRLAGEALGQSLDDLLPQTRQLLVLIDDLVSKRAREEQKPRSELRFTQRELREAFGWHDRSVRRHLLRLVELEYVLAYRTGRGNERQYQLLYDGQGREGERFLLGLLDVAQLTPPTTTQHTPLEDRTGGQSKQTGTRPAPHRRPTGTPPAAAQSDTKGSCPNDLRPTADNRPQNGQATQVELSAS